MLGGRLSKFVLAGGLFLSLGAGLAFASADEVIQARQACMKANGKAMGVMVPMFKGEKPYDNGAIQAALEAAGAACADWSKWWGEDTMKGETVETFAKPEVWSDAAGFKAAGENYYAKFMAVKATTDEAGFKAAFPELGASCQSCHEKFRRPKG